MKSLMLIAGAAALVFASASAEPPHGPNCPPGQQHCWNKGPQSGPGQMKGPNQMGGPGQMGGHNQMGGPAIHPGPMGPGPKPGPMMGGPKPGPMMGGPKPGPVFRGGPGWNNNATDWHWQDNRGGWHRDHDRYWQPNFRGGFIARDRLFFVLRQHNYNRFDGDPYWFRGHFVVRTFDRWGHPVIVELNPYTGAFIGIIRL